MALFIGLGWRNGQTNIAQRETPHAGGETPWRGPIHRV